MKKILASVLALSLPVIVYAQAEEQTIYQILGKVANMIFKVGLSIATIFLIFAGITFMTAQGEPGKIEKAKNMFVWTIIGLIVLLCSQAVVDFVDKAVRKP